MKVLVMGGNRYIGLNLVYELARQGHEVTVFNSHPTPMPEGVLRLHGDRRQPGVIQEVLGPRRDEFDAVFDNTSYRPADVQPLVEIFRGRVNHFVFTSSVATYLPSDVQPVGEDFPVSDDDATSIYPTYGTAKVFCERLLHEEYERNAFPATCLRVSHTCGPRSPNAARDPGFFARLEAGRPILVAGDGMPFIHVIHVLDAARAMCAVLGKSQAAGQIYNIAGSQYGSILGYIHLMAKVAGKPLKVIHVPPEIAHGCNPREPVTHWREWIYGGMVFSIEKARRDLGWEPQFDLVSGLEDSYRWFDLEGRGLYTFDFSQDDALLARLS